MPVCILDFRWASSKWNLGFEKKKKKYSLFNTFLCDEETKFCVVTLSSFFVVVQSLSRVWLFVTPWTAAHQAPLSSPIFQSLLKLMSIELVMLSNHLILCCPQYFPASGSFPMSWFFASGGQSIGASASASVLPMNIQGWFPLGLTGLISLLSKGLLRVFSSTTFWRHQFFNTQPFLWSNSHIHTWLLERP